MADRGSGWWLIPASLLGAFFWEASPLHWQQTAPEAVLLVMIYWAMRRPHQLGSFTVMLAGLLQDAMQGTLLGHHALTLVLVVYVVQLFYQRLRMFAIWQQALVVMVLALFYFVLDSWLYLFSRDISVGWPVLLRALVTGLCWPLCYGLLRFCERGSLPVRL